MFSELVNYSFTQRAIPQEGDHDRAAAFMLLCNCHAGRQRDRTAQDAVGEEIAPVQVLGTSATAAHSAGFAHQLGEERVRLSAIGQEMTVAAVVADHYIIFQDVIQHTGGIGFLTQVSVGSAGEYPFREILQYRLLEPAHQVHIPVQPLVISFHRHLSYQIQPPPPVVPGCP